MPDDLKYSDPVTQKGLGGVLEPIAGHYAVRRRLLSTFVGGVFRICK